MTEYKSQIITVKFQKPMSTQWVKDLKEYEIGLVQITSIKTLKK